MSDSPTTEQTPTTEPVTETPPPVEPVAEAPAAEPTLVNEPEIPAFDPEKLTLPEGFDKGEHFDQFVEWSKEAGINQPQAEKLVGLYADAVKKQFEATSQAWEKTNADWQAEVKADKELGGANLTTVKQTISKVLDNPDLADPKFREALDLTGAGNNPAVIRTLYRLSKALTEGASIAGGPPARNGSGELANAPKSLADAFYPGGPRNDSPRFGS